GRARFGETLLAWERASCFPTMELTTSHALLRALFWPIRVGAVQSLVSGTGSLDQHMVSELGVDRKGLFALEFLLFGAPGQGVQPLVEAPGTTGMRARLLSLAIAENVAACAKAASDTKPVPTPADPNPLLTLIVSQMSSTIGSISSGKL